jgi:membrane dipeptidase
MAFTPYLLDLSSEELKADIRDIRRSAGIDERYTYPYELYWEITDTQAQIEFLMTMRDRLGPATIEMMMDHIDYVVNRIGIDHVGISTDFNHGGGIEGFGNASEAVSITAGLLARGYSAEQIEKIWGGNFLRVMRAAEQTAQR